MEDKCIKQNTGVFFCLFVCKEKTTSSSEQQKRPPPDVLKTLYNLDPK